MSNELIIPLGVFFATILGGICVYEYSAFRTQKKLQKYIEKYKLEDIINILTELKEALL